MLNGRLHWVTEAKDVMTSALCSACLILSILSWFPVSPIRPSLSFSLFSNPECRYLASSSKDGTVRVWDTVLGRCEKILTGHTQSVTCVKWGGDGLLYTSSQDRTVKVWRAKDVSVCVCVWLRNLLNVDHHRQNEREETSACQSET